MSYQTVIDQLAPKYPAVPSIVAQLQELEPLLKGVGLRLMDADEILSRRNDLHAQAANPYDNLLCVISDPGGELLGPWIGGKLAGRLSWYHADEIDLAPEWWSLASFKQA